jgi:hypothetical protein
MNEMQITITKESKCPYCGYIIDRASGDGKPKDGDITICFECLSLSEFTSEMTLKKLDEEKYMTIRNDKQAWLTIGLYRNALKQFKKP